MITLTPTIGKDLKEIESLLLSFNLPVSDLIPNLPNLYWAKINNETIGTVGMQIHGTYGLLRSLAIVKNKQKKGYGTEIVNKILSLSKEKGVKNVYLLTTTAQQFFLKRGFKQVSKDQVPHIIKQTYEFQSLCPKTAICMYLPLDG